jgi:hypothetical protein
MSCHQKVSLSVYHFRARRHKSHAQGDEKPKKPTGIQPSNRKSEKRIFFSDPDLGSVKFKSPVSLSKFKKAGIIYVNNISRIAEGK